MLRSLCVKGYHLRHLVFKYIDFFKNKVKKINPPKIYKSSRFIQGVVEMIHSNTAKIRLADSAEYVTVQFDYLVFACGSTYKEPIKPSYDFETTVQLRENMINKYIDKTKNAKNILIIGGYFTCIKQKAALWEWN